MADDQSSTTAFIPLAEPFMAGNELEYVASCVRDNWVSSVGAFVDRFEADLAAACGARYGVATSSGTAALHVALLLAGVAPGEEVLTSDLTFIASANAIRYTGALPVLVDADPDTWQMQVPLVADFLRHQCRRDGGRVFNRSTGRRVAALMPVHVHGHPVEMDGLCELAAEFGLPIVEDATEALGSTYKGRKLGSIGRLGCFSFNGNKLITTGGGGMIVTDDEALARRAKHLTTQARTSGDEYVHDELGFNYRLTNLQAAVGVGQLEQLDAFIARKREIAARYDEAFADLPGVRPQGSLDRGHANMWLYAVTIDPARAGIDARGLLTDLKSQRIQGRTVWQPMHQSPVHSDCQVLGGGVSEALYATAASLPCSVGLGRQDQDRVIVAVRRAVAGARG
jgi:perosamine synthetase